MESPTLFDCRIQTFVSTLYTLRDAYPVVLYPGAWMNEAVVLEEQVRDARLIAAVEPSVQIPVIEETLPMVASVGHL